jgi:hypothetical protein
LPFVSRLSLYIEEKKQEIRNLKNIKKAIYQDIKETTDKKKVVLSELENLTNQQRNMLTFFQWYSNLKQELQNKYNIIIEEEFEYFAKTINDFKSYNYDIHLLLKDYRKIESLRQETRSIQDVINIRSPLKNSLLNEVSRLNDQISYLKHTINTYYQLYNAGFVLKELKQLSSTIMEISLANNISIFEAASKFLKDIEDQYDNKLGFEAKVNELKSQMEKLKDGVPEYKYYLQLQGVVGPVLNHLSINGVTNEDIIGINHLVSEFKNSDFLSDPIHRNKDNKILGNNTVKTTYQYWVLFTQKLKELKNINSEINKQTVNLNTLIVLSAPFLKTHLPVLDQPPFPLVSYFPVPTAFLYPMHLYQINLLYLHERNLLSSYKPGLV